MYSMDYLIDVGEMAPDFTLPKTDGKTLRLYDCKNRKAVVLFFFNHDDERCLTRLATLGRDYQLFKNANAVVLPVGILKGADAIKLRDQLGLPFQVLYDKDHSVVEMYKAGQCAGERSHVCFEITTHVAEPRILVVDPSGTIRHIHHLYRPGGNPDNATLVKECQEAFR